MARVVSFSPVDRLEMRAGGWVPATETEEELAGSRNAVARIGVTPKPLQVAADFRGVMIAKLAVFL